MRRIKISTVYGAGIFLICLSLCAFARRGAVASGGAGQSRNPAPAATSNSDHRITLNVVVTDKSGKPVSGLQQDDFTLLDNKRPEKIVSFQAVGGAATTDAPLEVILLVDNVNVAFTTMAFERDQIVKALHAGGGDLPYPTQLDFFSDPGTISRSTPSRDPNVLVAALDQQQNALRTLNRSGQRAGYELMQMSLDALRQFISDEATQAGRKAVIWISPGWPVPIGPNYLTSNQEKDLFTSIVDFSTELRQANITLYGVDPLGSANPVEQTSIYEQFLDGVRKPGQALAGDLDMEVLADQSGGLVLHSNNDIAGEIDKCIADASAYYVISFDAPPADGPNEYHALQVKIGKPGLTARTNTAYYDQP